MEDISKSTIDNLVEQAKVSKEKFVELYRLFLPKIFSYVSWRIGSRTDAEDIVSEVFIRVVKNLSSYTSRPGATFQSWLYQITKHAIADHYRRGKSQEIIMEELPETIIAPALEEEIDRKKLFTEIFEALKNLPEREAEVIRLKLSMGLSNKEIAETMRLKEKSVSSSVAKGFKKLRHSIKQ